MKLDAIGDGYTTPGEHGIVVMPLDFIGSGAKSRGQGRRHAPLERVAGEILHLRLDDIERGALSLPDLDGEQLQEMPVVVGCGSSRALRTVQQPTRDIEPDRTRTRRSPRGRVGRPHAGRVNERSHMRGQATRVPRRVFGVNPQERDW